jgi:hypothetical protein
MLDIAFLNFLLRPCISQPTLEQALTQYLLQCVEKYKLEEQLVCYTADNTNSNCGGVKRKGNENVFRKVQSDLFSPHCTQFSTNSM